MKGKKIFDALTDVDEKYIEEARTSKLKKASYNWKKWATIAASLVLLVSVGGFLIQNNLVPIGGSSGGAGHDEGSTFMSYAGPVFPLTLSENDEDIRAEREITFDFSFPSKDSIRVWGAKVEDSYILSNNSTEEKTVRAIYPFAGSFGDAYQGKRNIFVGGDKIESRLYSGSDFADSDYIKESNRDGNSFEISSWEGYKSLLKDGNYLRDAFATSPSLNQDVIVYTFTDFQSPEEHDAATQAISFNIDSDKTRVLIYGFNGVDYGDGGFRRFSYFVPKENHGIDDTKMLIVIGDDIKDYKLQGYKTGACEDWNEVEGVSATITRTEDNLKDLMKKLNDYYHDNKDIADSDYRVDKEIFLDAFFELIDKHGLYSLPQTDNYSYGAIEDVLELTGSIKRVFYLEFEVTIPASSSINITANTHKEPSHDFGSYKPANKEVQGYDMVTKLDSNINYDCQRAILTSVENINIIRQNFGFDIEKGISEVELDMEVEHYYLEVNPVER